MKLKNRFGNRENDGETTSEMKGTMAQLEEWEIGCVRCMWMYESSFIGNLVRTNWCAAVQRITIDGIKKDETT